MTTNIEDLTKYLSSKIDLSHLNFNQEQFQETVKKFMSSVMNDAGIESFSVVCDSTNNTAETIKNNQLIVDFKFSSPIYLRHIISQVRYILIVEFGINAESMHETFESLGIDKFELIEIGQNLNTIFGRDLIDPFDCDVTQTIFKYCWYYYNAYEACYPDATKTLYHTDTAEGAIRHALTLPTLLDALTWISDWDTSRAIRQYSDGYTGPEGQTYETFTRYLFNQILDRYNK